MISVLTRLMSLQECISDGSSENYETVVIDGDAIIWSGAIGWPEDTKFYLSKVR